MINPIIKRINPTINATITFNLGLPGALINREKFGLKNANRPIIITIIPNIITNKFGKSI